MNLRIFMWLINGRKSVKSGIKVGSMFIIWVNAGLDPSVSSERYDCEFAQKDYV